MKTKHLVVDTAAFVKNVPLWEYGEEFLSVPEIIGELRDKATRQRYEALPVTIKMREPQPWAIRFINQFSKKTGDFASLSLADVKVLALTYELEIEARGSSTHLRSEPQKCAVEGPSSKPQSGDQPKIEGFHLPTEKRDDMTNSSDIPLSESSLGDVAFNTSDDSPTNSCDDTDLSVNSHVDQPLTLPSLQSYALNNTASDLKEIVNIFWCHMLGLEDFLSDHSYIGGHTPTSDDCNVYEALIKEYPQFRPSPRDRYSSVFSATSLPPSNTVRPLHSTFPCIRRWSYHIASFSEKERNQFPSSGKEIIEVLHDFGGRMQNREEISKAPDLIVQNTALQDNALQVDMNALSMADQDPSSKKENKEIDKSKGELHKFHQSLGENGNVENGDGHTEESDEAESDDSISDEEGDVEYEYECEDDENEDSEHFNENEDADDEGDDDEGWITPSNIKHHKLQNKDGDEEEKEDVLVACVTADFSIQNVLKHIGLSVMGVDGKIIKRIRTYILRCYACFKTCADMSKIFCPKCGNKTLKRVSVTVNPDGTQKIWINFKRPINTRGMIFTLPKPKGGQHARNPILVADQKEARQFSSKKSKKKVNPLHDDYDPDQAPFAVRDVYSRAAQFGYMGDKCHSHYYWERKNPNVHVKKGKKKK